MTKSCPQRFCHEMSEIDNYNGVMELAKRFNRAECGTQRISLGDQKAPSTGVNIQSECYKRNHNKPGGTQAGASCTQPV